MFEQLSESKGVLVNEQLARIMNLKPNDKIAIYPHYDSKIKMQIVGIYSDSNPKGHDAHF